MDEEIKEKNVWLKEMQKYKKGGKEDNAIKAGKINMKELFADMKNMPDKVNVVGPVQKPSDKGDTPFANKLHGGDGKSMC